MCVCVCVLAGTWHGVMVCMSPSKGNVRELALASCHMDPRDQTQVVRVSSKLLNPLCHLISPSVFHLLKEEDSSYILASVIKIVVPGPGVELS